MNEARERPILFNAEMVRAVLSGTKSQTRRVIKPQFRTAFGQGVALSHPSAYSVNVDIKNADGSWKWLLCPYGKPGDRLWVRETWAAHPQFADVAYRADGEEPIDSDGWIWRPKWKPSIHMPHALSRITLEVVAVRVERVQDISTEDIITEGLSTTLREHDAERCLSDQFRALWDSINAARGFGWDVNPWVWVVEFRRVGA